MENDSVLLPRLGGCAQQGAVSFRGGGLTSTLHDRLHGGIVLCSPQAADLGTQK